MDSLDSSDSNFVYSPTIMKLVALLFMVVGLGFLATGLLGWFDDDPVLPWFMGGLFVFIAVVFWIFIRYMGRQQTEANRLQRDGIAGQATIASLTQTGMYLNKQPKIVMDLLVQLPDRQPYQVRHSEFVPLIMLGRLTSGAPLPVMVDPANPQKLHIDWSGSLQSAFAGPGTISPAEASQYADMTRQAMTSAGMSASAIDESMAQVQAALQSSGAAVPAAFSSPDQANLTTEQIRAHLREQGIEGTARIDQVNDTGQTVGDERLYTMQVTLEMPGQPPRQLQPSAAMVPLHAAPKVRVGWRIPVRVAADNHQLIMFEWEKV
jgi:hypothetical protein